MKYQITYALIIYLLLVNCNSESSYGEVLERKDLKRIVLVGGSLISSMENYGYFEYAMIQHYKDEKLSFRNIGWPADDVFGLARSQFGSAQNTQSWRPPTAEEGFGSKVLMDQIDAAEPATLIIGYGSEAAFYESENEFELFESGYKKLVEYAQKKCSKIILLSPPKQESNFVQPEIVKIRNERLNRAHDFIKSLTNQKNIYFADLFNNLIQDVTKIQFTENGSHLNALGYKEMAKIIMQSLIIETNDKFLVEMDKEGTILSENNCKISDWTKTVNGVSFSIKPEKMLYSGAIKTKEPVAIFINGKLLPKVQDTIININLTQDSMQQDRLLTTIKEKNMLYRYKIRPLNEAYIYLFRKHEMGHLAYEMDDLQKLVEEKEREIQRLISSQTYDIEIELIKPWKSPKNYPEDEVPNFIPEPNISEEIAAFVLGEDYEISLFASDPMIANPININWDSEGRAWVATSSTYPHIVPGREPNDKIIILEDTDNDGKADKHTVFADHLLIPHSVMPVKGGAYVTATTQLLFLGDKNGDDISDERRVIFDGFGNADVHHTIHGLKWTPWGDLHFTQSIYINSFIETVNGPRVLNGSGIWSFRPETESLEIFSRGLINPWGEAFDKWGQAFATDGAGSSGINYIFPGSAHASAVGANQILEGLNENTPKNISADVVYSRHFSNTWQGSIITNDFRANRTVRYEIKPDKSGYSSKEVETVVRSDHRSYRPVDSKIGPDGALYIVDWYNPIIDHGEVDFHHPVRDKTHGRIWKITKKGSPLLPIVKMKGQSPEFLLNQLKSPEQLTRLLANRSFVDQKGNPSLVVNWINQLKKSDLNFFHHRIEGLWLLAALNYYSPEIIKVSLKSTDPNERAAALRMVNHFKKQKDYFEFLSKLILDENSQVRLEVLHCLRENGGLSEAELAIKVLDKPMDANLDFALAITIAELKDAWLPKFNDLNTVFEGDPNKQIFALLTIQDKGIISPLSELLSNSTLDKESIQKAWLLLAKIGDSQTKASVLKRALNLEDVNLLQALVSAPEINTAQPSSLSLLQNIMEHDSLDMRIEGLNLAKRWKAIQYKEIISKIGNETNNLNEKLTAFRALMDLGGESNIISLARSETNEDIRSAASAVWIEKEVEIATPNAVKLLKSIKNLRNAKLIFTTFRKIEDGPLFLEKALVGNSIPENVANVGLEIAQTTGLNLANLEKAIRKSGSISSLGLELTRDEKEKIVSDAIDSGNIYRGSEIYRKKELLCATCHKIGNAGGLGGPPLTLVGSFSTPNAILESILEPSSEIKQNYETMIITKNNGEVVSGLLHRKTGSAILLRFINGQILEIPNTEISKTEIGSHSLMPKGLTANLNKDELKDLLAYLMSLGVEK